MQLTSSSGPVIGRLLQQVTPKETKKHEGNAMKYWRSLHVPLTPL